MCYSVDGAGQQDANGCPSIFPAPSSHTVVSSPLSAHRQELDSARTPMSPPGQMISDAEIMASMRRKDPEAMQDLYDRYFRRAFALAVRMLGDAAAAED